MSEQMLQYRPSQLITNTIQYTEYNLYLHGKIGEPDDFMEHFSVFKTANEGDVIRLYITSEGGSLASGQEYIRHMNECAAPIIGILGVEVASMASAIALNCDEIEVDEMSTMLVHSFSYGAFGSESAIYNQATFNNRLNERWVTNHYSNFLSPQQLQDVFKGVDVMLSAEEIMEGWQKLKEYRESQPCNCGNPSCERSPENMEAMDGEPSFEEMHISLEDMIKNAVAASVEEAINKAFTKQRKSAQKSEKKSVDSPSPKA